VRRWINLFESTIPIWELFEIIEAYVHHGEMKSPNQFDDQFDILMRELPRPTHGYDLFRVLRLTDEQFAHWTEGRLSFNNRKYSSWTKSLDSAHLLAQTKGDNCLIVSRHFDASHIVVDVADFYRDNDFVQSDRDGWHRFVVREQEVIVHDSGSFKIDPSNAKAFSHASEVTPMIDDRVFFHGEDDSHHKIEDVDYEQEFANRGLFSVTLDDGEEAYVRNTGPNEWEIVNGVM
jgi:hypothetical protein